MNNPPSPTTPSTRGFAALWAARDVSALGNWVLFIGLLAWCYRGRESAAVVSIVLLAQMVAPFLLAPLAALVAGRVSGQVVGIAALLLRAAALYPLFGTGTEDFATVVTVALVASLPTAFVKASLQALLPGLAGAGRLDTAERALSTTRLLTLVVGPAAGYAAFANSGLQGAAVTAMAALALAAALLLLARPRVPAASAGEEAPVSTEVAGLREGLRHVLGHPPLQSVASVRLAIALLTGGLVAAEVAFMVWGLYTGTENIGLVLAAQGLGIILGAGVHRLLRRAFLPSGLVAGGLGLAGMAEFGFAISTTINAAAGFAAVAGLGLGLAMAVLAGVVSRLAARGLARAASAGLDTAAEAVALLSVVAVGPLTDAISPRFAILVAGILLVVLALFAFGSVADAEAGEAGESVPGGDRPYPSIRPA